MNRKPFRIAVILAWSIAFLFLVSATFKIIDPNWTADSINAYQLLPPFLLNASAILLPSIEICAALALLVPSYRLSGAIILTAMTVIFLVAVTRALMLGLDISCGCFGSASTSVGFSTLFLDILLLSSLLWIIYTEWRGAWRTPDNIS